MLTLLLLLSSARADGTAERAYRACCDDRGVDCPSTVAIVGPGSESSADGVNGLWLLTCDAGASFFPHARSADASFGTGELAADDAPAVAACFVRSCALPEDVCLSTDVGGRVHAVRCGTTVAADARALSSPPKAAGAVGSARQASSVAVTVAGTPTYPTDAVLEVHRAAANAPAGSTTSSDRALWSLPPAPPDPCVVSANLRGASDDQVAMGDEARVVGDVEQALGHYRAALQVNACNTYAWTALGTTFVAEGYASRGAEALTYAIRIAPAQLPAWVALARADEALGRNDDAIEAWQQAVALRPGYPAAEDALARLGRGP